MKNPLKKLAKPFKKSKTRKAKDLIKNQAKLDAAAATGDLKKVVKYTSKVARSTAASEAKLLKYRAAVEAANKFFGETSVQARAAWAKLAKKAAKYGVSVEMPDFPELAVADAGKGKGKTSK